MEMKDFWKALFFGCVALALHFWAYFDLVETIRATVWIPLSTEIDWAKWETHMLSLFGILLCSLGLAIVSIMYAKPWMKRSVNKTVVTWLGTLAMVFVVGHTIFLAVVPFLLS